jgi:saccharopine dehydrogenase-like NADP-dependent oxidoreductase
MASAVALTSSIWNGMRIIGPAAAGLLIAVVLALLAKGQIDARGVVPPEAAIDPGLFFEALAPRCSEPFATGAEMILITVRKRG